MITSLGRQGGRRYPQLRGLAGLVTWLPSVGTTETVVPVDPAPVIIARLSLQRDVTITLGIDQDIQVGMSVGT